MSAGEIQYRGYRPGDESRIVELYNAVFPKPISQEHWRWEYASNPIRRCDIALAFHGETLVGHSAGVPLAFRHERREVSATRIQDVFVHPDFQRRGVFTETLRRLTRHLRDSSVDFVVAFPNDNSLPGFLRTGEYGHLFDIFPLQLRIDSLRVPDPSSVRIELDETLAFCASDADVAARRLGACAVFNPRAPSYLAWRYHPDSGKRYVVTRAFEGDLQVGWAAAKVYDAGRSLDLVELFLPADPAVVAAALGSLARHFRAASPETFSVWSMAHYPLHACLIDLGFEIEQRPTHVVYKEVSRRCSPACRSPSSYYLAMGDSDVY